MDQATHFNPLTALPPDEVPLKNAPLVRVLAQVRFPLILSIERKEFVSGFQEALRKQYPILQPEQTQGFVVGMQGIVPTEPRTTWRFTDLGENWRVTLAPDFVALETTAYLSRNDFLKRLEVVLAALETYIQPQVVERLGLRYIDRLVGEDVNQLADLVRPEISGIIGLDIRASVHQTINESLFNLPNGEEQIVARWGLIPAGTSFDLYAIEPIDQQSWILDLDMSLSKNREFNIGVLMHEAQHFAERIYTFFRWAVTPSFLRRFGGDA
ncbi:TIGR04255 family protein [Phormidesmis sp. 146-35]